VSVVIPTYNHAHLLGRALQSVIDQTYDDWEAIVVDNHSQDETDAVVSAFGDSRIRLRKIHNDGVIAASRNLGMREAVGEWIAFLDSDDYWYPAKLSAVMAAQSEATACDVLANDELRVGPAPDDQRVLRYGPYEEEFYRVLLESGNRLSTSATVVRTAFVRDHGLQFSERREFVTVEDYGFWLDLAQAGAAFVFVPEILGEFVIHGANNSGQLARHLDNAESLLREHVFRIQKFESSPDRLWRRVSQRLLVSRIRQALAERRLGTALTIGLRAAVTNPTETAAYVAQAIASRSRRR